MRWVFLLALLFYSCLLPKEAQAVSSTVEIVPDVWSVTVPPGGAATFRIRLSSQPAGTVTIAVSRYMGNQLSGDPGDKNISVTSGGSLNFTPTNWNVYQAVTLKSTDPVGTKGTAVIRCTPSDSSMTPIDVVATGADTTEAGTWVKLGPFGGMHSFVETLSVLPGSPKTIYAGTRPRGVFKSVDGGKNWSLSTLGNGSTTAVGPNPASLRYDPADPNTVYVGWEQQGVFKTTDAGKTWNNYTSGLQSRNGIAFAFDLIDRNLLYLGTDSGLHKSVNGGVSWTRLVNNGLPSASNDSFRRVLVDPANSNILYTLVMDTNGAGFLPSVYKSTDKGVSWLWKGQGLDCMLDQYGTPRCIGLSLDVAKSNPQILYVITMGYYNQLESRIYRSANGGNSWTQVSAPPLSRNATILVTPSDPTSVYVGQENGLIYHSSDSGQTWTNFSVGLPFGYRGPVDLLGSSGIFEMFFDSDNEQILYAATGDGLYRVSLAIAPTIGDGDANSDSQVNALDLKEIITKYLKLVTSALDQYPDLKINTFDFVTVLKRLP